MTAAPTAAYPQHWEADVLLADGGVVHLRPSGPADADAVRAMHGRLSAKTLYLRYFSPVSTVSDERIATFTDVDYDSRTSAARSPAVAALIVVVRQGIPFWEFTPARGGAPRICPRRLSTDILCPAPTPHGHRLGSTRGDQPDAQLGTHRGHVMSEPRTASVLARGGATRRPARQS